MTKLKNLMNFDKQQLFVNVSSLENVLLSEDLTELSAEPCCSGSTPTLLPVHHQSPTGNKHISVETLNDVLNERHCDLFDHFIVIDCRYKYEYDGGHIDGAIHVKSAKLLEALFRLMATYTDKRIAWIFHCEYSQKRGPRAAAYFRKLDRICNQCSYPNLCFPHTYVIHGGYKTYVESINNNAAYISMFDANYSKQMSDAQKLEKEFWPKIRQGGGGRQKRRRKINRSRRKSVHRKSKAKKEIEEEKKQPAADQGALSRDSFNMDTSMDACTGDHSNREDGRYSLFFKPNSLSFIDKDDLESLFDFSV